MRLHAHLAPLLLLLAGCGNAAFDSPSEELGAASSPIVDRSRGYTGGYFELDLDGVGSGLVHSMEGGDIEGEVVALPAGTDYFPTKHIGKPKYNDFVVRCPFTHRPCVDWVRDLLAGKPSRRSGRIVAADAKLSEKSVREFDDAVLTEVQIPALDGSSKDPAYLTIKFKPELVRYKKGSGAALTPPPDEKPTTASSFALTIPGLDTKMVSKVDAITIKQNAGSLEVSNLRVTLPEWMADSFADWHRTFVIEGKNDESQEKTGSLALLSADRGKELVTINFSGLGIFKVSDAPRTNDDKIQTVSAEMYVETVAVKLADPLPPTGDAGH